jgi:molybdopterin-guanine dinucleotide biosynthesis protein A
MRSAVILVGGEARRANGEEKYFFTYGGRTFIERLISSLNSVTDEIIIVARDPAQCTRFSHIDGVQCITDIRKGIGPIGGLHAGAKAARGELVFVAACDMPCVNQDVVSYLFDVIGDYDAVIPCWNREMYEPLHAVYRRPALISFFNNHKARSLRAMVGNMKTKYVSVEDLRKYDRSLETFTNINRLDEQKKFDNCKD